MLSRGSSVHVGSRSYPISPMASSALQPPRIIIVDQHCRIMSVCIKQVTSRYRNMYVNLVRGTDVGGNSKCIQLSSTNSTTGIVVHVVHVVLTVSGCMLSNEHGIEVCTFTWSQTDANGSSTLIEVRSIYAAVVYVIEWSRQRSVFVGVRSSWHRWNHYMLPMSSFAPRPHGFVN